MQKLYIRYSHIRGKVFRQEIVSFCLDGAENWINVNTLKLHREAEVKCLHCGANNWTENGRTINEYECGCCGSFILVEPKN